MFQLVEQGCGMTVAHEKLQHNVLNVKAGRNGKFSPQFDPRKLTPAQRAATGKLVFRQTDELVTMDLPITQGSYHGVPLNGYHAYRGTEVDAGISSFGLVLGVPLTEAKRRLAQVRFQSEEELSGGALCENMRADAGVEGRPQQTDLAVPDLLMRGGDMPHSMRSAKVLAPGV